MFWRITHDFLKWLWPACFAALAAISTIAVAASQVWPAAKDWTAVQFERCVLMLDTPLPYALFAVVALAWAALFVWSGHKARESDTPKVGGPTFSHMPRLEAAVTGLIIAGETNGPPGSPICILLTIKNLGTVASSIPHNSWNVVLKQGELESRLDTWIFPADIDLLDARVRLLKTENLIEKMRTPVAVGSAVDGYIICIIKPDQKLTVNTGDKLIVSYKDIFGQEYRVEDTVTGVTAGPDNYHPLFQRI